MFAVFVQLFNQINARKINDEMNVFSGIIHSHLFIYIWLAEAGLQVQGTSSLHLPALDYHEWRICCSGQFWALCILAYCIVSPKLDDSLLMENARFNGIGQPSVLCG